jgi:hypothetical protein
MLDIVGTKLVTWDPPPEGGLCGEKLLLDSSGNAHRFNELPIGTMFYVPKDVSRDDWPWWIASDERLSDYYHAHTKYRQPLLVILPGQNLFCVDSKCWNDKSMYGGWQVTGIPPAITISPSINIAGTYHGWIINGVISEDCEGRVYTP